MQSRGLEMTLKHIMYNTNQKFNKIKPSIY